MGYDWHVYEVMTDTGAMASVPQNASASPVKFGTCKVFGGVEHDLHLGAVETKS